MKKLSLFISIVILIFPIYTYAEANTLGQLKAELAALKKQKAQNDSSKQKTQNEINAENNKISAAHGEVEKAENDIVVAENEIKKSNKEIEKMKKESEKLLVFYEIMQGENEFIEYVSGASTISDMIIRADAVSQILSYNQSTLNNLEEQIAKNEQLKVDLAKKQIELKDKITDYENSLSSLKNDLSSLVEVSLDISSQITAQQKLINYYEEIGCKDNELLTTCINVASSSRWMKPTVKGYISSGFGYRSYYLNGKLTSGFHSAVDVAGNSGGTPVYAAASGTVAAVISKSSCGGNQIFIHVRVQGVAYTLAYAHLMNVYVKVGDQVTQQDVIGTVGGGGITLKKNGGWDTCSTGYHLHFGVAKGFYLGGGSEGYSSYNKFISQSIAPPMMPAYGQWYYSRI